MTFGNTTKVANRRVGAVWTRSGVLASPQFVVVLGCQVAWSTEDPLVMVTLILPIR
jgi:hypothetical protein